MAALRAQHTATWETRGIDTNMQQIQKMATSGWHFMSCKNSQHYRSASITQSMTDPATDLYVFAIMNHVILTLTHGIKCAQLFGHKHLYCFLQLLQVFGEVVFWIPNAFVSFHVNSLATVHWALRVTVTYSFYIHHRPVNKGRMNKFSRLCLKHYCCVLQGVEYLQRVQFAKEKCVIEYRGDMYNYI